MAQASAGDRPRIGLPAGFWPSPGQVLGESLAAMRMAGRAWGEKAPLTHLAEGVVPVLLIPGFMARDWTMNRLAEAVSEKGLCPIPADIGMNLGCTLEITEKLTARLEAAVGDSGEKALIVGWSRGGMLGKLLALDRPDLVQGLVTLGTPHAQPLAVSHTIEAQLAGLYSLHALGAKGVMGFDCVRGKCAAEVERRLMRSWPKGISFSAIYSQQDGVVDWRACLDPDAEMIEVEVAHMEMGATAEMVELISDRLLTLAEKI